jgi:hypothetical protein
MHSTGEKVDRFAIFQSDTKTSYLNFIVKQAIQKMARMHFIACLATHKSISRVLSPDKRHNEKALVITGPSECR